MGPGRPGSGRRARRRAPNVLFPATVSALAVMGWACGGGSAAPTVEHPSPDPGTAAPSGPVVEQVPVPTTPPLDPDADPTTPLGELRARYLPVWSAELDWAFPPEVCGSDWALDAVARPDADADPAVLGDPLAAAALSVMRYEHLLAQAFAAPSPAAQLCVAVATVDPERRAALESLAGLVSAGDRSAPPAAVPEGVAIPDEVAIPEQAAVPEEVAIVAASPGAVMAVACVEPGEFPAAPAAGDDSTGNDDLTAGGDSTGDRTGNSAQVTLAAYLLELSRGLEDTVADVSYRVAEVAHRFAEACDELDGWADRWQRQAQQWAAEGLLWNPVSRTVTTAELCDDPPPDGPDECPRDWWS